MVLPASLPVLVACMILFAAPLPAASGGDRHERRGPALADVEHATTVGWTAIEVMGPSLRWSESRTSAPLVRASFEATTSPAEAAAPPVQVPPTPPPPHEAAPPPPPSPTPIPAPVPTPMPAPPPGPPTGKGTVALDPASTNWLHRRAAAALAMISYPWERLGYELVFEPARSGVRGQTTWSERRIQIFVRPSDSVEQTAFDLAHEVAHAFDFARGANPGRWAWMRARALESWDVWFGCDHCDDLATPAGDFAESFAYWQVPSGPFGSRLGSPPSEAQRALLAEITSLD